MKKILAFLLIGLLACGSAFAYNWDGSDRTELLNYVFDATTGHNHDGTNSKTVTIASPYGALNGAAGVTGVANGIEFEGATADAHEAQLLSADVTADVKYTLADAAAGTYGLVSSTLVTNAPAIANSVTGGTNQLIFEGATVDAHEAIITATDPTSDTIWTLPVVAAGTYGLMSSTLATNGLDIANSVYGGTNQLIMEGATADAHETIITPTDATADRTITIPNKSGQVQLASAASVLTPSATITLTVGLSNVYTLTPTDNQDGVITFSGAGTSGDMLTIVITTTGTADESITFHATLVSSGAALVAGTTAARKMVISFISDGSKWNEIARTAELT